VYKVVNNLWVARTPKQRHVLTLKPPVVDRELLKSGQHWTVSDGFLKVVRVGKRLVEYKLSKDPSQKGVRAKLAPRHVIQDYLRRCAARLKRE